MKAKDRLRELVTQVELSSLSAERKNEIYDSIGYSLRTVVYPVLVKYMDDNLLLELNNEPRKITAQTIIKLFDSAFDNKTALNDIEKLMQEVVLVSEEILKQAKVIPN